MYVVKWETRDRNIMQMQVQQYNKPLGISCVSWMIGYENANVNGRFEPICFSSPPSFHSRYTCTPHNSVCSFWIRLMQFLLEHIYLPLSDQACLPNEKKTTILRFRWTTFISGFHTLVYVNRSHSKVPY